jgi:NADH dehydrogenase
MQASAQTSESLPQVIIVGGGFGGLSAAKELAEKAVRVTLIDRTNHHLFQPLLYQVATAALSPADIAQPIRHIFRDAKNIEVMLGEVDRIDCDAKQVWTTDNVGYPYDYLILAAGARHSYFGHDEWEAFAPGLKSLEDAIELRRRILSAFEAAELATSEEDRQAALTFIIVGAGPTGVEMAGAIAELAHKTLSEDFRRIDSRSARILLLDGAPRVLPSFSEDLSRSALAQLKRMGVEVHTGLYQAVCPLLGHIDICDEMSLIERPKVLKHASGSSKRRKSHRWGSGHRQKFTLWNQILSPLPRRSS